jgi:hypothetical protein
VASASGLLVHIGYHKTGSTWLQHRLFRTPPFARPLRWKVFVRDFIGSNPLLFDAQALQEKYSAAVAATLAEGAIPVLSAERLSGSPHSGGHDARAIADRLAEVVPGARILIVIRRQHEMLVSSYKQYVRIGGPMSCRQYATPPLEGRQRVPLFQPAFLEYDLLVAYYQRLFSRGAVLVLPYEQLLEEPEEFCAAIGRHVGADVSSASSGERLNASSSALAVGLRRHANRVLVRDAVNPTAVVENRKVAAALARLSTRAAELAPAALQARAERKLDLTVSSIVRGRYAESNARTAAITGLDLSRWGYDVTTS